MKSIFVHASLGLILSISSTEANAQIQRLPPAPAVIFDTDIGPDYDDVGAITLLHYYADIGKVKILATIASNNYSRIGPVLSVLNTYFGRPSLPIGVPKGQAAELYDSQKWSDTLVSKYPHGLKSNDDAPDAVKLYRRILASQPNRSVTVITVGFFTNIAGLLRSKRDEFSSLDGPALVNQKVSRMVSMAGKFPAGKEFNLYSDARDANYVFQNWTRPVVFSGFEIGEKIKTGIPLITNDRIQNSPVKDVFGISIPKAREDSAGRMSWDETAVVVAVNGYKPYYDLKPGRIKVTEDGSNTWVDDSSGKQYYLVEARPPREVETLINKLLMHTPLSRVRTPGSRH